MEPMGEMAEKVIPLVRFPVFMRVVLPGALAAAVLFPFTAFKVAMFAVDSLKDLEEHAMRLLLLCALIFVCGALIAALNGEIYKVYEGRTFWPGRLRLWGLRRQQRRVDRLRSYAVYVSSPDPRIENRRLESWEQLRIYPVSDGEYYADKPTRLGNILAGYEQYPDTRYGMSSVFYFPRIWMRMEKEKKKEIDGGWAVADGFLSLSAAAAGGGVLWVLAGVLGAFDLFWWHVPFGDSGKSILGGVGLLILAYLFYRVSLPFHLQNGEIFKAIFDLYRSKAWPMTEIAPGELQAWDRAWLYYQHRRLVCRVCGKEKAGAEPVLPGQPCPNCGNPNPNFR